MADISTIVGVDGSSYNIKDATARGLLNGHSVNKDVPQNAVFTDTTYENKAAESGGTDTSLVTTGDKYNWDNKGDYTKPSGGIPDSDIASASTWNGKANASGALSLTLASGSWSSATPPTQSVTATGVTASNNIIVGLGSGITSAQFDAAAAAKLVCTAQSTDSITITAYGTKPTENIPINVVILG